MLISAALKAGVFLPHIADKVNLLIWFFTISDPYEDIQITENQLLFISKIHLIIQSKPYVPMVLTLSWRRNIDIQPVWDILYKSSLPENTLLLFLAEYHGMSWRFASVLPFTDWCVLENISDTGCLVHAPFIYLLLHSSDMFGHPCLQSSVCHQGSMMAISVCFNTQDENALCRFASVFTYLFRSLILDWPLEILPLFNSSFIHSSRESPSHCNLRKHVQVQNTTNVGLKVYCKYSQHTEKE